MGLLILIVSVALLFIGLFLFFTNKVNTYNIVYHFKKGNVVVCGHKGNGKDLLFQWVINKRHDYYYSNISYGGKKKIISIKDISCEPNDYDNLINNRINKTPHKFYEKKDIYISDAGNFLPAQMDSLLHKKYKSMPLYYSLSRHLYNSNVHMNAQSIERLWKIIREQADFFVCCKRTYKLPFFLLIKTITYDKYESCKAGLLPLKYRWFNKQSKAQYDLFRSTNGDIRTAWVIVPKRKIYYDTRAFEKILLKGRRKQKKV